MFTCLHNNLHLYDTFLKMGSFNQGNTKLVSISSWQTTAPWCQSLFGLHYTK